MDVASWNLKKIGQFVSSLWFAIRLNPLHPQPSLFLFGLLSPRWWFSTLVNYYRESFFNLLFPFPWFSNCTKLCDFLKFIGKHFCASMFCSRDLTPSNPRDRVWSYFQTRRRVLKIRRAALEMWWNTVSSWGFDISKSKLKLRSKRRNKTAKIYGGVDPSTIRVYKKCIESS